MNDQITGLTIRGTRRRLGLTQAQLARRLGVDQATVSRWERGVESPRPKNYSVIERLFLEEEEKRQKTRAMAMIRHNLAPSVLLDRDLRLIDYSDRAVAHYSERHNFDLSRHKGRTFKEHCETLGSSSLWSVIEKSGLTEGEPVLLRIVFNIRGAGHSTIYEPILQDGKFQGTIAYLTETFDFPDQPGATMELAECISAPGLGRHRVLYRGQNARFVAS